MNDNEKDDVWIDEWPRSLPEEKLKGKAMSVIVCVSVFALFAAYAVVKGVLWILK